MEFTATILRYIYSMIFMWLLATLIIQPASPFGADVVCQSYPELLMTDTQAALCKKYPGLISHLITDAGIVFKKQLYHHFKHERWNGRWNGQEINPPIFGSTEKFLQLQTKESAFVYALASAAVVHTVAKQCVENKNQFDYCGCDKSLSIDDLREGEKWAGCSPDMNFSIAFAKKFLDTRMDNETYKNKVFVLHNNNIGRMTVKDYMHKTCTCTGSGSKLCSKDKTCKMTLPTMHEVATKLRKHYDGSIHSKILHQSGHSHPLVVDRVTEHKVHPEKMIHFSKSHDYCEKDETYNIEGIAGRDCIVNNTKTSSSHHCNNLCCGNGYETYTETVHTLCNCKFIWCCSVNCYTCEETKTKYKCKSKSNQ